MAGRRLKLSATKGRASFYRFNERCETGERRQGRFAPPMEADRLPASLLERFSGEDERARLLQTLAFLGPLTTRSAGMSMGVGDPQTMRLAPRRGGS